jgi:hypothetical protein
MPPRITKESCRPRVSNRTMVGICLLRFRNRRAASAHRAMKQLEEANHLGSPLRGGAKAVETKSSPSVEGLDARRTFVVSGGGRKMSLDIPFHRTFPQLRRRPHLSLDDRDHFLQNPPASVASLRRLITSLRNADHDQPGIPITFAGIPNLLSGNRVSVACIESASSTAWGGVWPHLSLLESWPGVNAIESQTT